MKGAMKYLIIAAVILVLLIVGIIFAAIFGVLLEVLYIFLMLLAALMVAATFLQVYSIIMLIRTITTVRNEVGPLMNSVKETVGIVQNTAKTAGHAVSVVGATTQLTSEIALGPSVRAVAAVVAGQQMLRVFFGRGHVASRADQRRKEQLQHIEAAAGGD